jgi:hypothetical protein
MNGHDAFGIIAKYRMEERTATEPEMNQFRAKHPIKSKLRPKKYAHGLTYADSNGYRGTYVGKPIGGTAKVKRFGEKVGGERYAGGTATKRC